MTRGERIKEYEFSISSLTSNAGGVIDIYTDHPLNGRLLSINNVGGDDPGSWVKTGSLHFTESGTGIELYNIKSGTSVTTGVLETQIHMPRIDMRKTTGSVVGLSGFESLGLNSVVRVIGSGLGASKSGLGLTLRYV